MSDFLLRLDWATARGRNQQDLLEDQFQAERASALGSGARRLERALMQLGEAHEAERPARLAEAQQRAWEFMVQREAAGLRDWPEVVRFYRVPSEVLRGMGAVARPET